MKNTKINDAIQAFSLERWKGVSRVFAGLFLLASAFPLPLLPNSVTPAYSQQAETGILNVEVFDSKKNPVAGVKIKIYDLQGQQVAEKSTDEKGQAQIPGLKGTYTLETSSEKYDTRIEENLEISSGSKASVSIELIEKLGVVVEIESQSSNIVERQDQPAGELKPKDLRQIPTLTKEFDGAIGIIPNVIRPPDGKVSIKGSREDQSLLLINGVDGTDPSTGAPTKNIPLESISSVKVYTNPYLPEYGRFTGGVIKVETKRGGDKFKADLTDFFPEPRFRGGKLFGFANVSPRLHLEGPILKDKIFFAQGLEFDVDKKPVRGLPSPINEIKRQVFRTFTQIDFILSPNHTFTATINGSLRRLQHIGLDFFNPQNVAPDQNGNDFTLGGVDRITLSNGSLLETFFQYKRVRSEVRGKGDDIMTFTPLRREGNYFHREDRATERYQLAVTNTFAPIETGAGKHSVKVGIDLSYVDNQGTTNHNTVNINRLDKTTTQKIQYFTVGSLDTNNTQAAAFVQDQWLVNKRFSFDYGIRFEAQKATAGVSVMPRLASAYSLDKDGDTVIRGAVGLFYDKVPLNVLAFPNAPTQTVTDFALDGITPIGAPRSFLNIIAPRPSGKPNRGNDFSAPRNLTFNIELNQKITSNALLKVAYLQSRTDNDLYISPVTENGINAIKLFNDGRNRYRSLEVTTSVKLPKIGGETKNDISFSYVRSRAQGELNDFNTYFGDFPDPVIRPNQFGRLSSDAPNRFLARGTFSLPYRFTIVPLLDIHTGFPYSIRDEKQDFVGERNSARFPRFASLDMSVSKDIKIRDKYNAQLTINLFNVASHFNPRNVKANIADPEFGVFFANYRRFYRLDFGFSW